MNWEMISAIGSFSGAIATALAVIVALYIGLRERNIKIYGRGLFIECDDLPKIKDHPNCYKFEIINTGNTPIYLSYIQEKAHFKKSFRGLVGFIASHTIKKDISQMGKNIPDISKEKYLMAYTFKAPVKLKPGKMYTHLIPFSAIQQIQLERRKLNIFSMDRNLIYYAVDLSGKKYRLNTGATPNSYIESKTCHLIKASILTGKPIK